jgi:hypothetical protein
MTVVYSRRISHIPRRAVDLATMWTNGRRLLPFPVYLLVIINEDDHPNPYLAIAP